MSAPPGRPEPDAAPRSGRRVCEVRRESRLRRLPALLAARRRRARAARRASSTCWPRTPLGRRGGSPVPTARPLRRRCGARPARASARLPARGRRARHRAALRAGGGGGRLGQRARSATPSRRRASSRPTPPARSWSAAASGSRRCAPAPPVRRRAACPPSVLLGFRDRGALGRARRPLLLLRGRPRPDDGHLGQRGYVTDLLAAMLEGDDAASAAVYACGPPAMLEAVRAICAERGVACELALESPMACGFGACFGCAVPLPGGGYMRLCVDGPVVARRRIAEGPHA